MYCAKMKVQEQELREYIRIIPAIIFDSMEKLFNKIITLTIFLISYSSPSITTICLTDT